MLWGLNIQSIVSEKDCEVLVIVDERTIIIYSKKGAN